MKCEACNGTGKRFVDEYSDFGLRVVEKVCYNCNGSGSVKSTTDNMVQTNEDWFDTLSTEEKAKWLDGLIAYCFGVGHITETEQKKYQYIVADVEAWLKEPHKEKHNG